MLYKWIKDKWINIWKVFQSRAKRIDVFHFYYSNFYYSDRIFSFFLAVTKQKQNPLNEYYFNFISLWRQEFIQQIALYIQQK